MTLQTVGDRERLSRFVEHTALDVQRLADETRVLDAGWAVRTHDLPRVWTLNQLCVTAPLEPEALRALADDVQREHGFRHVVVRDAATARAAEPVLLARGWRVEHDTVMALDEVPPDDGLGPPDALTEDEMVVLMAAWLREEFAAIDDVGLRQVLEYNRREGRLWRERRLGVVDDGRPVTVTKLRVDGDYGWVEDVYTLPDARGRGHARRCVGHAARAAVAAGCSTVMIVADADDWPQHLYARLGFREVGTASIFHQDAPDGAAVA